MAQEGPELLDFSVDEVAEQLTLLDAVRPGLGVEGCRGAGCECMELGARAGVLVPLTRVRPWLCPIRSSSPACGPGNAWALCGRSGTGPEPRAAPPRCAPR